MTAQPEYDIGEKHAFNGQGGDDPNARMAVVRAYVPRLDLAALLNADRPARDWLWWRVIPEGAAVAIPAPAGTGKSLLLLALMVASTRGDRAFAGLKITNRRILYIDMENTEDDLAERLRDLGVTVENAADLDNFVYLHLPTLPPLDTPAGGMALLALVDAYEIRARDVVVLDSIQRLTIGKENDSDTIRAYYRHTGLELKRRGLTVIRTDNTGKDTDKGARGSSGKRDDVDVELIMERDKTNRYRFTLTPGKIRLPDIDGITIELKIDDDGRIFYDTARDPLRLKVAEAITALDRWGIPLADGEKKIIPELKAKGIEITRDVLRVAIKERRYVHK